MKKICGVLVIIFSGYNSSLAQCQASTSKADLDIGNVRAAILINGDMWSDLTNAQYEIPKGSGKNSLSRGAFWIGGKDNAGNLKVAAQTYRQGSDFWPGPIDTTTSSITPARCLHYDQHWKITRQEVADFINGGPPSNVIINWPGNGDLAYSEDQNLAPFYDASGDGIYDYLDGDYPKYEFGIQSSNINNRLNGDQTIWWVFNDVGNVHGESSSTSPVGVEIHAQAYAFCTTDSDLSNTTFYSYKIINRSPSIVNEVYIGNFTDPDLGNYLDDYIGCDVGRNLGYSYNGDLDDDGALGYGTQLAAVGIDLLGGPLGDPGDNIDNDHDSIVDEPGETIVMSGFIAFENNATVTGNPFTVQQYYNYLDGKWKDNSPMVFGGTGYGAGDSCEYMFPGNSDPNHLGTHGINPGFEWTESLPCLTCAPNTPGDRRFLMNTGKFTMYPGSVNYFTKAAVWARANGGIDSSIQALKNSDDKIQSFFDSYFNNITTCPATIGINEVEPIHFSVYPSPARNYIIFNLKDVESKMHVAIFSVDGKLVYQSNSISYGNNKISTSDWSSGIYFFRIENGARHSEGKFSVIE